MTCRFYENEYPAEDDLAMVRSAYNPGGNRGSRRECDLRGLVGVSRQTRHDHPKRIYKVHAESQRLEGDAQRQARSRPSHPS